MKKTFTKILSVVLCAVMVLGAAPLGGLVGLDLPSLFDFKAEAATYSGTCGENLTWSLNDESGILTINGTGAMTDYDYWSMKAPWGYSTKIKQVIIGNKVTTIGSDAFCHCSAITSVTIPDSVKIIGDGAFEFCNKLSEVNIGKGLGDTKLRFLFGGTINLKNINIDENNPVLYSVDGVAFAKLEDGSKELRYYPRGRADESYTVPYGIKTIGEYAFSDCAYLKSIALPESVTTIEEHAFYSCDSIVEFTIPDNVKNIGSTALGYCENLSVVNIGRGVEYTGIEYIFKGSNNIKDINVDEGNPVLYSIDGVVFANLEDGSKELVFYPCGRTDESYSIPEGTTDIDGSAFENGECVLRNIRIPASMEYVSGLGYNELKYLQNIEVEPSNPNIVSYNGVVFHKYSENSLSLVIYPPAKTDISYAVPDNVTNISGSDVSYMLGFKNARYLKEIHIPLSVGSVDDDAFYNCAYYNDKTNWENGSLYVDHFLIEVDPETSGHFEIKEGTVYAAYKAFDGCENITELTIPSSFKEANYGFSTDLYIKTINYNAENTGGLWRYNRQNFSELTEINIGYSVKEFDFNFILNSKKLKNVILPDSVEGICVPADLKNCSLLEYIHLSSNIDSVWYTISENHNESFYFCIEDLNSYAACRLKELGYKVKQCDGSHAISYGVKGIEMATSRVQLSPKTSKYITATVLPEDAYNKNIIWTSSNEDVAVIDKSTGYLYAVDYGYTTITATTQEGGYTDTCLVFVGDSALAVWGDENNVIKEGDTEEFFVSLLEPDDMQLLENDMISIDSVKASSREELSEISFVVADSNIASVEKITNDNNALTVQVKGKSYGSTYVTVTNNATGEVKFFPIYVMGDESTYNTDDVPQIDEGKEHRGIKNFYHNGIYVYDYAYTPVGETTYASFNAYNSGWNCGAVEVYDAQGNLKESHILSAFDNNDMTGVVDNVERFGALIETWVNLDCFDPTSEVFSAKTEISVAVPNNGYIKITNDISDSTPCLIYNLVNIAVDLISRSESISIGLKGGEIAEKVSEPIINKIGSKASSIIFKLIKEINKNTTITDTKALMGYLEDLMDSLEINFSEIFIDVAYDVLNGELEDVLLDNLGGYGMAVNGIYEINGAIKTMHMVEGCQDNEGSGSSYIYAKQSDDERVSNGIIYKGNISSETVFRTFAVTNGDVYDAVVSDTDAWNLKLYEISMVRDGRYVQPTSKVQVQIPIPSGWNRSELKVHRVTENASFTEYTDMNATIVGDYLVFETDHFSYYVIVDESEFSFSISCPSKTTIAYGDTLVLQADLGEATLPEGWSIQWTVEGSGFNMTTEENGMKCKFTSVANGNATIKATLVNESGEAILDAEDNEISNEITLKSNASFWQKIVSFFKNLFRINRIIY